MDLQWHPKEAETQCCLSYCNTQSWSFIKNTCSTWTINTNICTIFSITVCFLIRNVTFMTQVIHQVAIIYLQTYGMLIKYFFKIVKKRFIHMFVHYDSQGRHSWDKGVRVGIPSFASRGSIGQVCCDSWAQSTRLPCYVNVTLIWK